MTGRTHDLAAFTALNATLIASGVPHVSLATGIVALGAVFIGGLTPDIDQPTADLWRRLPAGNIIGRMITPILGSHRMISHSIVGTLLVGWLLAWFLGNIAPIVLVDMVIVWWAFMIGFVSHLCIDLFNKEGIPLFFPIPWRIGIPPLSRLRIVTGDTAEKVFVYPLLLILNGVLVYRYYDVYLSFLRTMLMKS